MCVARVIDKREDASAAPVDVGGARRLERGDHLVGRDRLFRDAGARHGQNMRPRLASKVAVMMWFSPEPVMLEGGIVVLSSMVGILYQ